MYKSKKQCTHKKQSFKPGHYSSTPLNSIWWANIFLDSVVFGTIGSEWHLKIYCYNRQISILSVSREGGAVLSKGILTIGGQAQKVGQTLALGNEICNKISKSGAKKY